MKGLRAAGRSLPKGNRPKSPLSKKLRAEVNRLESSSQLPLLPKRDPIGELLMGVAPTLVAATKVRRAEAMAEVETAEAKEAVEAAARPPAAFIPGDLVRMTAKWLCFAFGGRGPWGDHAVAPSEVFTIHACQCEGCASGRLVAVPHFPSLVERYGPLRHILATNVEHAQLAPAGPIRKEDRDAILEQVGVRVDDDGNYFLRPPWAL